MPGILYSPVLSFPTETREFELVRGPADVSKTILEGPPETDQGVIRAVGAGFSLESTGITFHNPSAGDVDLELKWSTPDGEDVEAFTLGAGASIDKSIPVPLLSDESIEATILSTSVGDRVHIFVTSTIITGERSRKRLTTEWQSILPPSEPGRILIPTVGFTIVVTTVLGATVETRLVKEGFPDRAIETRVIGPDSIDQVLSAIGVAPGMSFEARLTAGDGFITSLFLRRPITEALQAAP